MFLFLIISCNPLLHTDRVHAIPADIGKTFKPIPLVDRVIEVDVAPIIKFVCTDSKIVFRIL